MVANIRATIRFRKLFLDQRINPGLVGFVQRAEHVKYYFQSVGVPGAGGA